MTTPTKDLTTAVKLDAGKPRMDLIAPEALQALGSVLAFGAEKYAARNWEKGMSWGRVYAAVQRHLNAWAAGQDMDPESGMPHLWHALTGIHFLVAYEIREAGDDDRSPYAVSDDDIDNDDDDGDAGAALPAPDDGPKTFVDAVVGTIEAPDEDEDDDADLYQPPTMKSYPPTMPVIPPNMLRPIWCSRSGQWLDYSRWVRNRPVGWDVV